MDLRGVLLGRMLFARSWDAVPAQFCRVACNRLGLLECLSGDCPGLLAEPGLRSRSRRLRFEDL